MEKKSFATRGRFGLPKDGVTKIFRLIRSVVTRDFDVSSSADADQNQRQQSAFNVQAYMLAKQRMLEVERMKAMLINESRHNSWKAGGPI